VATVALDLILQNSQLRTALGESQKLVHDYAKDVERTGANIDLHSGAKKSAQKQTSNLKEEQDKAHGNMNEWAGKIKGLLAAVAAAFIVDKIKDFGAECVKLAADADKALARINAAVKANGQAAGFSGEQLEKMAEHMSKTTHWTKQAAIAAESALLPFTNVRDDMFKRAMDTAAGLADVLGTDLPQAAQRVGKALQDPREGLQNLHEAGIRFTLVEEQMVEALVEQGDVVAAQAIIMEKLEARFAGASEIMGDTFAAKVEKAKEAVDEAMISIGKGLMPAVETLLPYIVDAAEWFGELGPAIGETCEGFVILGKEILQSLKPVFEWLLDAGATVFTALEYAIEHWRDIFEYSCGFVAHGVVKMWNEISYYFTEVIPQALGWFADNWKEVFYDMGNYVITVFKNLGTNIWEFIKGVKGMLTGSGESFQFVALTEGFEATVKEFPKIAERQEGAVEKALRQQQEKLADKMSNDFGRRMNENRKALFNMFGMTPDDLGGAPAGPVNADDKSWKEREEADRKQRPWDIKQKGVQATFEDLTALNKRIQSAAASEPVDIAKQQLAKQEEQRKLQEEANKRHEEQKKVAEAQKVNQERQIKIAEQQRDLLAGKPATEVLKEPVVSPAAAVEPGAPQVNVEAPQVNVETPKAPPPATPEAPKELYTGQDRLRAETERLQAELRKPEPPPLINLEEAPETKAPQVNIETPAIEVPSVIVNAPTTAAAAIQPPPVNVPPISVPAPVMPAPPVNDELGRTLSSALGRMHVTVPPMPPPDVILPEAATATVSIKPVDIDVVGLEQAIDHWRTALDNWTPPNVEVPQPLQTTETTIREVAPRLEVVTPASNDVVSKDVTEVLQRVENSSAGRQERLIAAVNDLKAVLSSIDGNTEEVAKRPTYGVYA